MRVTLHQGVYHQIKRMFGVYDAGVNTLHRLSIGGVALDATLAPGEYPAYVVCQPYLSDRATKTNSGIVKLTLTVG